jgi:hypothetical protein
MSSQQPAEAPMDWFRQGLFAPVTEEVTAFDLPVIGRIPSELNGRYLRNGPNFMPGLWHGARREVAGRPGGEVSQSLGPFESCRVSARRKVAGGSHP